MSDLRLQVAVLTSSQEVLNDVYTILLEWWSSLTDYAKADYLDTIDNLELGDYIYLADINFSYQGRTENNTPILEEELN